MRKLRIAYVCDWDASDPNAMSGAAFYMRKAFLDAGHDVIDIFPVSSSIWTKLALGLGAVRMYIDKLRGRYTSPKRTLAYVAASSWVVAAALRRVGPVDFIFSQSSLSIAGTHAGVPLFLAADQSFDQYVESYVARPSRYFLETGRRIERSVAINARHLIYPSQWAKAALAKRLPELEQKVLVIPWGGNLRVDPDSLDVHRWISERAAKPQISLTFVGRDWKRKGGASVVEAFRLLRERGFDIRLTIIGATPSVSDPGVEIIPSLNKQTPEGWDRFVDIMVGTTFLFVPSTAEAYGHVFCEAAAFGVPSVTTNVGGIPSIVSNGVDGLCLPATSAPAAFADAIEACVRDKDRYVEMSERIALKYRETHSWRAFAAAVCASIAEQ